MRTLTTTAVAALASAQVGIVSLVNFAFSPTPVSLNTSNLDLVYDGVTYKGAFGLGSISPVTDKPGDIGGLAFELISGDSSNISLALDAADVVQGTVATVRTAIVDLSNYAVLDAPIEWTGTLDTMSIAEDGGKAIVRVTAESKGTDLLRGSPVFYSDADQRRINANDGSMRFVVDQIDKPVIWPTREFFYK